MIIEFEAVNLERQNQVQEMACDLDTLLVDTTTKRSQYPRKITQKVAQRLQCQHEAVVSCLSDNLTFTLIFFFF